MTDEFISYGEPLEGLEPAQLTLSIAKKALVACLAHRDFELIALRQCKQDGDLAAEVIVVDCTNDAVPSRNTVGIRYRERLALVFHKNPSLIPEVRTLRRGFPITPHQNHVGPEEPSSLCLYFEPWSTVERSWTPQYHLNRILWWLALTANGTLHREEQPAEQIYFNTPYEIVLPPDFEEMSGCRDHVLVLQSINPSQGAPKVIRGAFMSNAQARQKKALQFIPLVLKLSPILHGNIERFPLCLGELLDQLESRRAPCFEQLCQEIKRLTPASGIEKNKEGHVLLILHIPIQRSADAAPERYEVKGFLVHADFAGLGGACGVLNAHQGKYFVTPLIGGSTPTADTWRSLAIEPVEVSSTMTRSLARKASGIPSETADFSGVVAGVGALGSALVEIWYREAWGTWTLIDNDYIKPHNLARHLAKDYQIGLLKADAVKEAVSLIYFGDYAKINALIDKATNWSNSDVRTALESADFVIDATTTLEVPRELARSDQIRRAASVFLTPSGRGAVLLLEDTERKIRLDSLEAQYYRAVLNEQWGESHLSGHLGHLWVGAGCRDISAVISTELVQLHGSTLARQLRLWRDRPGACVRVWEVNTETGALAAYEIPITQTLTTVCGEWRILWDTGLQAKLKQWRAENLPNETGGILLGYIDQKLKFIFVVDALPAPADSLAAPDGFTRGTEGLDDQVQQAGRRTANIVRYIGEWHSHPPYYSATPSSTDLHLLAYLAEGLARDGQPALMLIVAGQDITVQVCEAN